MKQPTSKKKEFTEAMQDLFKKIDSIEQVEKSYYTSLATAGTSTNPASTTEPDPQA